MPLPIFRPLKVYDSSEIFLFSQYVIRNRNELSREFKGVHLDWEAAVPCHMSRAEAQYVAA